MFSGTIAFLLGIIALTLQPRLPAADLACLLGAVLLFGGCVPAFRAPLFFIAGFLWALARAHVILLPELPAALEGETVTVTGQVVSLPETVERGLRFNFRIDRLGSEEGQTWDTPGYVRLAWYTPEAMPEPGDWWQFEVRLKRPYGFMNPGGFDYEGWLFQQRLRATGYVVPAGNHVRLGQSGQHIDRLRGQIRNLINETLGSEPAGALIAGLAIGDRSAMSAAQWRILRDSGTSHLLAISGLHIGLVAGLVFLMARRAWRLCSPLCLWLPAQHAAAMAGFLAALLYSLLAGLSVPTQRTLIMLGVVTAALLSRRSHRPAHVLLAALTAVLVIDPFAVMSAGFWLSFGAVALILYGMGARPGADGWWWRWGRVQWLVAIGLVPLLAFWFGQYPLFGACANLLAVPWVSFLVVPLVLCGAMLGLIAPGVGTMLFELAARALGLLWPTLEAIATADLAAIHQPAAPAWTLVPATFGVVLLLLPRGVPARWLGAVWLLPLLLPPVARPGIGEFTLTVLDVGQGLAAVVKTRGHTLVFDTGARFGADFDAGSAVLVPYLRHHGISRVDTLIVSHGDNDHIGGARELMAGIRVGRILTSVPERLPGSGALPCVAGQRWRWDGVVFVVLHPEAGYRGSENDRSCVLKIGHGRQSALLTGDIEAAAEQWLVRRRAPELKAAVLIAPHHGSRTSSTSAFIAAVDPEHVLFAAGYRNRYGHPRSDIIARYHRHGAQTYITFRHGAVRIDLRSDATVVTSHRAVAKRFWHAVVHD